MTATKLRRHIEITQGRIGRAHGAPVRRELYARLADLRTQLAAAEQAEAEPQEAWA